MNTALRIFFIIIGLICISTPFLIISIWNEEANDLPCYDKHNKVIEGHNCIGIKNEVMDRYVFGVIILCFGGLMLSMYNLIELIKEKGQ